jgi:methylmalonyl-CoA mutase N-terminal domain/subunit
MSAVLGGTQSLHTNGFDEALALPAEQAATVALRTQQIIGYESGVADVADPFGGSYVVEYLTDHMVEAARGLIGEVDGRGGSVAAIESGFIQDRIEESAYEFQRAVDEGRTVIVGVNRFQQDEVEAVQILRHRAELEQEQKERLGQLRANRDNDAVSAALGRLQESARGTENLLPPMREAHAALATIGEVTDALRRVFGTQDDPAPAVEAGTSL